MNAKEILELISKQWADIHDIEKLGNIGTTKASKIKKELTTILKEQNILLPNSRLIPMSEVVKYFGINVNYLKKVER